MKTSDVLWFSTSRGETIGIVLGHDDVTKEPKAYIGKGDGQNEAADARNIAYLGGKFNRSHLDILNNHFNPQKG